MRITLEIPDHGERHACIAGEVLPKTEARSRHPLIPTIDLLQFGTLRPEPVDSRFQPGDAMRVQIYLDEACAAKIS